MNERVLPKISFITISYNQGKYIQRTIDSIIDLNYENFEYIIIDGGSSDETLNIINSNSHNISYFISEKDEGPADALNKALKVVSGDLIFYLNSDDIIFSEGFYKFIDYYIQNPEFDFYYGHGYFLDDNDNIKRKIYSSQFNKLSQITGRSSVIQQATFINSKFLKSHSITFNSLNKTCWDHEILVDGLLNNAIFVRLPYSYYIGGFRIHSESITGSGTNRIKYLADLERINGKLHYTKKYLFFYKMFVMFSQIPLVFRRKLQL